MKICLTANSGFQVRYLLQTTIAKRFIHNGAEIKIISNPQEINAVKDIVNDDVELFEEPNKPKKNNLEKYFEYLRFFTRADYNSTSEIIYKRMYGQATKSYTKLGIKFLFLVSKILRRSKFLRFLFLKIEKLLSNYKDYFSLLERINPDILVLTSHGAFGCDKYLAYAAESKKIKIITIILSWDNITSQTYPAYYADFVIAWTETMKKDIIKLIDYKPEKVIVAGSAYFDAHFQTDLKFSKKEIFDKNNLSENMKTLFFATKSPNSYPWNPNIVKSIAEAINRNKELSNCQLLVRPHPIHYKKDSNGNLVYKKVLDQYEIIASNFNNVIINKPSIYESSKSFLMKNNESNKLNEVLKYTDVFINLFSTMNIEAAILDIPIVNICFEYEEPMYSFDKNNPRFDITSDAKETHNQRIVDSGGTSISYSPEQLIEHISRYITNPNLDKSGRKVIRNREVGPYQGEAGNKIADVILGYSKQLIK